MIFDSRIFSIATGICWIAFAAVSTIWLRSKRRLRNEIISNAMMFVIGAMHIFYFTIAYPLSEFTFLVWPLIIPLYLLGIPEFKYSRYVAIGVWGGMAIFALGGELWQSLAVTWYHLSLPLFAAVIRSTLRKKRYQLITAAVAIFLVAMDIVGPVSSTMLITVYLLPFWIAYWPITVGITLAFIGHVEKESTIGLKPIPPKEGVRYEVKRKGIHFFVPAILLVYPIGHYLLYNLTVIGLSQGVIIDPILLNDVEVKRQFMAFLLDIGLAGFIPVDVFRLGFDGFTPAKNYIRETMRDSETHGFLGSSQMVVGLAFANMILTPMDMIPLVFVVAYADITAALVGVRSNHRRIAGRSIDGLIAEAVVSIIIFALFGYGLFSLILGFLMPLLDIGSAKIKACDNLVYPLGLGVLLTLM